MKEDDSELQEWMEFARQSFENDLARLMDKKEMLRKHLAERMDVSPSHVTQTLGRSNNYQLKSLVKLARGVGAVLEIRLADEDSEVIRVLDLPTARFVDDMADHQAKIADTVTTHGATMLRWRRIGGRNGDPQPNRTIAAHLVGDQDAPRERKHA